MCARARDTWGRKQREILSGFTSAVFLLDSYFVRSVSACGRQKASLDRRLFLNGSDSVIIYDWLQRAN